jgi:phosphoribosylformylglycinamidine synthase
VKVRLRVTVMKKPGVLDPEGKAIGQALAHLGFAGVEAVRAGKVIELDLDADSEAAAEAAAAEMADRLLANGVIERVRIERVAAA